MDAEYLSRFINKNDQKFEKSYRRDENLSRLSRWEEDSSRFYYYPREERKDLNSRESNPSVYDLYESLSFNRRNDYESGVTRRGENNILKRREVPYYCRGEIRSESNRLDGRESGLIRKDSYYNNLSDRFKMYQEYSKSRLNYQSSGRGHNHYCSCNSTDSMDRLRNYAYGP